MNPNFKQALSILEQKESEMKQKDQDKKFVEKANVLRKKIEKLQTQLQKEEEKFAQLIKNFNVENKAQSKQIPEEVE